MTKQIFKGLYDDHAVIGKLVLDRDKGIGITQHLEVNCGSQGSDKVEHNDQGDKIENSHNSCYNIGEMLEDEELSTTSTQNDSLNS
ncbi:hypothetical protein SADUNF_Sadunf16G0093800 [Salix dunnii]|uniref:Uncharacterized protein n=1 Tax=Salix dunnii TaxID=1413687 RepID=A0A835MLB5_9ROSI|nr:hypothetical protein SADUNF_Sadunf16G0093800 [Salix dunnii]